MTLGRILVVDDEDSMCQYLAILLEREGHEVTTAGSGQEALAHMDRLTYDLVMTDIQMPQMDGIELLRAIRERDPNVPVVILTAYASEQSAIDAVNLGAFSYLQKHCKNDDIKMIVRNALDLRSARTENVQLKRELLRRRHKQRIIGQSPRMREVFKMIDKIAATTATVLIKGESGTGKELIAQAIHDRSERSAGPFVPINCGAIPETLLESQLFGHMKGSFTGADRDTDGFCRQASGGTIFLDEIAEIPGTIQVKLLRMLQEREIYPVGSTKAVKVDLRVIAATNRDLELEVAEGRFRTDLYYRLNVIPLDLPPLRERAEDIPLLIDHFLRLYLPGYPGSLGGALADEALRGLQTYEWPGNVRELENAIERASIIREGSKIVLHDLPDPIARPVTELPATNLVGSHVTLDELEKAHILQVLRSVGGQKKRASEILAINPSTLYRKLLRYEEEGEEKVPEEPGEERGAEGSLLAEQETLECGEAVVDSSELEPVCVGPDGEPLDS
jgi:DNA-binding NtrC family response regulator